jgi:hypothetical protein
MSMNGLLPGLSNRCPGTIGSCQYSTRRPLASESTAPAPESDGIAATFSGACAWRVPSR